ncbi:ATP-binding cassette domain-containing protein [Thalassolituus sp. LLYu03]|uniref:ABC transporter ATP-binding protein n=1 Tax=Thalassolituus sp. LLYu03 TaxID=3421656 RepID=UPI003D27355F
MSMAHSTAGPGAAQPPAGYNTRAYQASDLAIETHGMTRRFGDGTAVDQLDLSIPRGAIYGFLGPNGCGKSTSIRMLTGLLLPSEGDIRVLGHSLPHDAERLRPKIGYMTQKFSLYDNLRVDENLDFVGRIYGIGARERHARREQLINQYDLDRYRSQLAGSLSGGQKQRLALAAATLHHPELLFLDEPTSAVDPENRREFWEHLFDLSHQGTTILVSTHYMDEAERCHALAILEHGVKRADGSPQQLMNDMGARVIELSGPDLRELKKQLVRLPQVLSAAQLGTRLRVLVKDDVANAREWLASQAPGCEADEVRPSLEDVFVVATGGRHVG